MKGRRPVFNEYQCDKLCQEILTELAAYPEGRTTTELILDRRSVVVYKGDNGYVNALTHLRRKQYVHTVTCRLGLFTNVLTAAGWLVWARGRQAAHVT